LWKGGGTVTVTDIIDSSRIAGIVWAKSGPFKSLRHHMIDAGMCACVLLRRGPGKALLRRLLKETKLTCREIINLAAYLASLHDIGKCHPEFQRQDCGVLTEKLKNAGLFFSSGRRFHFRHEFYSEKILKRIWKKEELFPEDIAETLARVLSLHHQGKNGESCSPADKIKEKWESAQEVLENDMRRIFHPPTLGEDMGIFEGDAFAVSLMAIVILSDWIASGPHFEINTDSEDEKTYIRQARQAAQKAVRACGLTALKEFPCPDNFCDMWPMIPRDSLRPLQSECEKTDFSDIRLLLLEAPMGEGKTEAAIYAAARMMAGAGKDGFYIALPTSATSNQMHGRVNELFALHGLPPSRLLHGMAWLADSTAQDNNTNFEESQYVSQWLMPLRRGMLSQYAVGTVDQAMLAAMRIKYGVLRLLGLSDKVLIIDEIHAYDAYMSSIIERLLQWCRALDIPVVLLSATLPSAKKKKMLEAYGAGDFTSLSGYPLLTSVDSFGNVRQTTVDAFIRRKYDFKIRRIMGDNKAIANLAAEKVKDGGCLCLLMDTVRGTQELYPLLKEKLTEDTELIIFHARFTAERRNDIEKECIEKFGKNAGGRRPKKAVLLCTQVVEQSLDLDFDVMITQTAPIDLLLQRAGRVFRHVGTVRPLHIDHPEIYVLVPRSREYGSVGKIYFPLLLDRTEEFLSHSENSNIRVPEDMRKSIEEVYNEKGMMEELEEWGKKAFSEKLQEAQAQSVTLPEPDPEYFFALAMRGSTIFSGGDEEGSPFFMSASTRADADSHRVALLTPELFEKAEASPQDSSIARDVLMRSVSLRLEGDPSGAAVEGERLLKGCLLLCRQSDGLYYFNNSTIIINDDTVGIKIIKKGVM